MRDKLGERRSKDCHGATSSTCRWDLQWATDWDNFSFESCAHEYGAIGMLMRLMELPTKQKNKVRMTYYYM